MSCSVGVADLEVADHEAVRAVGADADVLGRLDRRGRRRTRRARRRSTTSSAATPEPSIWRLQRMHGPRSGIPCRSSSGGFGGSVRRRARGPAPRSGSGRWGSGTATCRTARPVSPRVVRDPVLRAGRVVRRRGPRLGLGVEAGHDHDAAVVAGRVDGGLDRVEVAALEKLAVQVHSFCMPSTARMHHPLRRGLSLERRQICMRRSLPLSPRCRVPRTAVQPRT